MTTSNVRSPKHNQVEAELRLSEAYLAEAQRLSHTGSWAWSPPPGDIRYWSEECYRVQGFDPKGGQPRFEDILSTHSSGRSSPNRGSD
jgi:hypothetical protein